MSQIIAYVMLGLVVLVAAVSDWRSGLVPNRLTYPAILMGLAYWVIATLCGSEAGVVDALLGLSAGLIPFAIIFYAGGLGGGDVKLMGAVGAISASWSCVLSTTVYALIIGLAFAIVIMIRRGIVLQTLGHLLAAAFAGRAKPKPQGDSAPGSAPGSEPTVPFAAAIAIGAMIAGAEQLLGWQSPWGWLSP